MMPQHHPLMEGAMSPTPQPCKPRRTTSCSGSSSDDDAGSFAWPGMPAHAQPRARQPQAAPGSADVPREASSSAAGQEQEQAQVPGVMLQENSLYELADAWRDASDAEDDAQCSSDDGDSLDCSPGRLGALQGQLLPHRGGARQAEPAPGSAGEEPSDPLRPAAAPGGGLGQHGAGPERPCIALQLPARLLQHAQRSLLPHSPEPAPPAGSRLGQLRAAPLGGASIARGCSSGAEAPALRSSARSLSRAASLGPGATATAWGGGAEPLRSPNGSPGHLGLRRLNTKSLASRRDGSFCYRNEVFDTSDGGEEEGGEQEQEEEEEVVVAVLVGAASSKRGGAAHAGAAGPKAGLEPRTHSTAAARRLPPLLELLLWVPSVWLALACLALMAARGAAGRRALPGSSSC
jgi:hypothetical protein